MPIDWHGEWDEEGGQVLPCMFTDVAIEWTDQKFSHMNACAPVMVATVV